MSNHNQVRYQVFVSSTYEDLREERAKVEQSLLSLDCIPTGMEWFPAADHDSWTHIQRLLSQCDYYILIVKNRYGSRGPEGKSFTEMEFDYASKIGVPILAFLYEEPRPPMTNRAEADDDDGVALSKFRRKIEQAHHRSSWSYPGELAEKVLSAVATIRQEYPGRGWSRGPQIRVLETNEAMCSAVSEVIDKRASEIKSVIVVQYSGINVVGTVREIYRRTSAEIEVYLADPDHPFINKHQKERVEYWRQQFPIELRVESPGAALKLFTYKAPGAIRAVLIEEQMLFVGGYFYEVHNLPTERRLDIRGGPKPLFAIPSGHPDFLMFQRQIKNMVSNWKNQRDSDGQVTATEGAKGKGRRR